MKIDDIKKTANDNNIPYDNLRKVIAVESGGFYRPSIF